MDIINPSLHMHNIFHQVYRMKV